MFINTSLNNDSRLSLCRELISQQDHPKKLIEIANISENLMKITQEFWGESAKKHFGMRLISNDPENECCARIREICVLLAPAKKKQTVRNADIRNVFDLLEKQLDQLRIKSLKKTPRCFLKEIVKLKSNDLVNLFYSRYPVTTPLHETPSINLEFFQQNGIDFVDNPYLPKFYEKKESLAIRRKPGNSFEIIQCELNQDIKLDGNYLLRLIHEDNDIISVDEKIKNIELVYEKIKDSSDCFKLFNHKFCKLVIAAGFNDRSFRIVDKLYELYNGDYVDFNEIPQTLIDIKKEKQDSENFELICELADDCLNYFILKNRMLGFNQCPSLANVELMRDLIYFNRKGYFDDEKIKQVEVMYREIKKNASKYQELKDRFPELIAHAVSFDQDPRMMEKLMELNDNEIEIDYAKIQEVLLDFSHLKGEDPNEEDELENKIRETITQFLFNIQQYAEKIAINKFPGLDEIGEDFIEFGNSAKRKSSWNDLEETMNKLRKYNDNDDV